MKYPVALLALLLVGCSDFPRLGGTISPSARQGPPPRIVPIDGLILSAIGPARTGQPQNPADALSAVTDTMDARIAALKARAAILRGQPVDGSTRALLDGT